MEMQGKEQTKKKRLWKNKRKMFIKDREKAKTTLILPTQRLWGGGGGVAPKTKQSPCRA